MIKITNAVFPPLLRFDLGADLGTDLGAGPGADLGADPGTDLGADLGADLACETGFLFFPLLLISLIFPTFPTHKTKFL